MDFLVNYFGGKNEVVDYPDEYFLDYIKKSNLLKETSKKTYLTKLDNIRFKFFDKPKTIWWVLSNPELYEGALHKFINAIDPRIYDVPSFHNSVLYTRILLSLFKNHSELQEKHKDLYMKWKGLRSKLNEPLEDHYISGDMTSRQEDSFMPFDKIVEIRDSLRDGSIEKLVLSVYSMIPPVRSDWQNVRIYDKIPSKEEGNYIVLGTTNKLFLNEYKTSEVYGMITIDLPKELVNQIKLSLSERPREYLFVNRYGTPYEKSNSYSTWINNMVRRVLNKPHFTLTMFRHIYLSRKDLPIQDLPITERRRVARSMGHSLSQQNSYVLKDKK
jgi:hypothetical protein